MTGSSEPPATPPAPPVQGPATHEEATRRWLRGVGVEIGAHDRPVPVPLGRTWYVDRFAEFAGIPCPGDFWGDATRLPFRDDSLDYVVSSHVLEHAANTLAALLEWHRVLRDGGIVYLVVPDRRRTFDRARAPTPVGHFYDDWEAKVDQTDATHVDDFIDGIDWAEVRPALSPEDRLQEREKLRRAYRDASGSGLEVNLHFHVFDPTNFLPFLTGLRSNPRCPLAWDLLEHAEDFPASAGNGLLAVLRVRKPRGRIRGFLTAARTLIDPAYPVAPSAIPLSAPRPGWLANS